VWSGKETESARVKYWEIIADNLNKTGWSWGCVSALDSEGRTIWIVDAHRDGKRFVVHAGDPPHGRGVLRGAKVGNGVAVGAGVAVAAGIGVATCACAPAKKATKPTKTHTLRKAIPDRIRVLAAGCGS
jgi:hypothetical protein